jgi:hypothetical protein
MQRQRTLLEGQPSPRSDSRPSIASFGERPMLLQLDSMTKRPKVERRKSVFTGFPEQPLLSRVDLRPKMQDIEEGKSMLTASPMGGTATKQPGSNAETATLEKRGSIFSEDSSERPLLMRSDPKPEMPRLDELERIPIERISENPTIKRIESAPQIVSPERRRSQFRGPPIRPSWPKQKSLSIAKERLRVAEREAIVVVKVRYVDAEVQTENIEPERCAPVETISVPMLRYNYMPPPAPVAIGSMMDFFRGQYSLGDALHYV